MNETETPPVESDPAIEQAAPKADFLYFKKVLFNMTYFVDKKPVQFEPLASNLGVLKISADDPVAHALTTSARANRGGIVSITEEEMEELKKKLPFKPLVPKSLQQKLRVSQTEPPKKPKVEGARRSDNAENVVVVNPLRKRSFSNGGGVVTVGGGGTGEDSGNVPPAPVSSAPAIPPLSAPPGEFRPATGPKNFKMPVTRKASGRSLSGATAEPELKED